MAVTKDTNKLPLPTITPDTRCPIDNTRLLIKRWKHNPHYYCRKCHRAYDLATGIWQPNWSWSAPNTQTAKGRVMEAFQVRPGHHDIDNAGVDGDSQ